MMGLPQCAGLRRHPRLVATSVLRAGLVALFPGVLVAQKRTVGVVVDSASLAPIPGAVVTITDSLGRARRQLLTDNAGKFALMVTRASVGLRVTKIGFKPATAGDQWVDERSLEIRMAPIAIVLDTVRTGGHAICPTDEFRGGSAALLWEQARSALLANVVARRALPAAATIAKFRQVFDPRGGRLLGQRVSHSSGSEQRPFGTVAPAQVLASVGFVVDQDDGRAYFAPDADVLLDPAFAANHCFGVVTDPTQHASRIGLSFGPTANAGNGLPDVAGILWFAADSLQLRAISFRYVNIEQAAERAGAGGELEFRTMRNGVVALTRWTLTAPVVTRKRSRLGSRLLPSQDSVTEINRIGGALVRASWPDGVTWEASLGTVIGRTMRSDGEGQVPAPGIRVSIDSTDYSVSSDSNGYFRIANVFPGLYTARYRDVALAEFGAEHDLQARVVVREAEDTLSPELFSSYMEIQRRTCGQQRTAPNTALLFGELSVDGRPPEWPVDVSVTWPGVGNNMTGRRRVTPKSRGRFLICGLPRGRILSIQVERDGAALLDTIVKSPLVAVGIVRLRVNPPRSQ